MMGSFSPLTREECKVDKGRERMQFFCDFSGTKYPVFFFWGSTEYKGGQTPGYSLGRKSFLFTALLPPSPEKKEKSSYTIG